MQQNIYGQETIDHFTNMIAIIQKNPNATMYDKYLYVYFGKVLKTQCIPIFILLLLMILTSVLMNILYGPLSNLFKICCA